MDLEKFKSGNGISDLIEAFNEEHERLFTFNLDVEHEIVNLRAVAIGQGAKMPAQALPQGDGNPDQAKIRDHTMWVEGSEQPAVIYERSKLEAGDKLAGPCIVVEMDSTAVILPDHLGEVDTYGNIIINPVA